MATYSTNLAFVLFGLLSCLAYVTESSTLPVRPTLPPLGCFRDGKFYLEGSHYRPSPCEWCECVNSREQCAIADCFIVECVDSVQDPDKCCPVCPNGMLVDKLVVSIF